MTNENRIAANNEELREAIATAESLPDADTTEYDVYDGVYQVTPKLESQTLATRNKLMTDDVTVEEIPISSVSNTAGGNTVIIG